MNANKKNMYVSFLDKKFVLNLDKIKEVCLTSSKDGFNREFEVSQAFEPNDDGKLVMSNKVEHETQIFGNQQNDMIIYDIVKLLIISLIENSQGPEEFIYDFGTCLTINTLINWGILTEVC